MAIAEHLEVTNEHVSGLEQVFEMMGKKAQSKNAMQWKVLQICYIQHLKGGASEEPSEEMG